MILAAIAWWAAVARADPATDLIHQRQVVADAAKTVAEARAEGKGRAEGEGMRVYRDAALALERMEAALGTPVEVVRGQRLAAIAELNRALAEGQRESPARAVLADWLGDPPARAALLEAAVQSVDQAPADIRRGVLLDVVEQSDALAVWLAFDGAEAELTADRLELRATSLRRTGPGQTASIADEVEAVRLEEQATAATAREDGLVALRERVLGLRGRAVAALEGEER